MKRLGIFSWIYRCQWGIGSISYTTLGHMRTLTPGYLVTGFWPCQVSVFQVWSYIYSNPQQVPNYLTLQCVGCNNGSKSIWGLLAITWGQWTIRLELWLIGWGSMIWPNWHLGKLATGLYPQLKSKDYPLGMCPRDSFFSVHTKSVAVQRTKWRLLKNSNIPASCPLVNHISILGNDEWLIFGINQQHMDPVTFPIFYFILKAKININRKLGHLYFWHTQFLCDLGQNYLTKIPSYNFSL